MLRIYHTNGANYFLRMWRWFPASAQAGSVLIPIAIGEWHCYKMKFVRDAVNGEYRVYFHDVEQFNETGLNTSGVADCDRIICGNPNVYSQPCLSLNASIIS
ncbi:hypothetical protein ES703_80409 [subsurface metagenome]